LARYAGLAFREHIVDGQREEAMVHERDSGRVVRRSMLQVAGVGSALALLGGIRQASATALPTHPKWKFVFVNHVTTNPFFVPTQYGIQDHGRCSTATTSGPVRPTPMWPRW
jgi:hypothetical protein